MGRLERLPIESALNVLAEVKPDIHTVSDWALCMGYSRSHFCRAFKKEFGIAPKRKLRVHRLRRVIQELRKAPDAKGYTIAVNSGFADEQALHKYLSFHCRMNLSEFKSQVL